MPEQPDVRAHAKALADAAKNPPPKTVEDRLTEVELELTRLRAWADGQAARQAAEEKKNCRHFYVPHGQTGDDVSCVHCLQLGPKGTKPSRLNR